MSALSVLTTCGRQQLVPLGVKQRGRSRVWLDDQDWWVGVVEFQPSSWSQGAYLNTGVIWLWHVRDHIAFDLHQRVATHARYESDEQFRAEAESLVRKAADAVLAYRERLTSPRAVADELARQSHPDHEDVGMAFALSGDAEAARLHLRTFVQQDDDDRDWAVANREAAEAVLDASTSDEMRRAVRERIARARSALSLGE
jgi:hypothetical protein